MRPSGNVHEKFRRVALARLYRKVTESTSIAGFGFNSVRFLVLSVAYLERTRAVVSRGAINHAREVHVVERPVLRAVARSRVR